VRFAHELNQPLGAVQINSEFMKLQLSKGTLDEALLKDLGQKIVSNNLRAGSIIQSLRSIFNEENSTANFIDLGDIVRSVLQITTPELSRCNIKVKLHFDSQTQRHGLGSLALQTNRSKKWRYNIASRCPYRRHKILDTTPRERAFALIYSKSDDSLGRTLRLTIGVSDVVPKTVS
jgi:signal transduction histidine kinase